MKITFGAFFRNTPATIMRCERTFRLARTHPAHARSSGSETLSRSRSLAGYTIDTHESEFSEATSACLLIIRLSSGMSQNQAPSNSRSAARAKLRGSRRYWFLAVIILLFARLVLISRACGAWGLCLGVLPLWLPSFLGLMTLRWLPTRPN